ncbi:MAG TPA: carboxypeptidase-like regulatory domain-containing protein [Candidatus Sulfopaludibacter sp.]|nr:carboxypeptidase-like regulatory domain-containing protein [Candidatus Sulfopaludibacter sp.]
MNVSDTVARFKSNRFFASIFVSALLLTGSATSVWGQTATAGTVAGQVTDEQNAAVPGTQVKIVEPTTGTTQTTLSNDAGRYIFSTVPPGKYNMTFTKDGFTSYQVNSQVVEIGAVSTINAKLKIGSTSTTVEVTATTGAELQTMNATVGNTLDAKALELLPNLGRDVATLAVLQPGVTPGGYTAGSHNEQNSFILDGGNITDDMAGNTTGYQTNFTGTGGTQTNGTPSGVISVPAESVEQMTVSTVNQTSDFANSSGSQIQLVTKRGSNQFHGAGYLWYFDTVIGAANSWTNNHTPSTIGGVPYTYTPLISNHRTRYGFSLGGPLTPKDFLGKKWYFYGNYEALRYPNVGTFNKLVPSALLRAGVVQEPNSAGVWQAYNLNPSPVTVAGVTYPTATCGTGACDPRGLGISSVVSQIWNKQMPLPNNVAIGDSYNTSGYLTTIRAPLTSNAYVGRVDHDFSDRFRWYATYRDQKLVNLTTNQVDVGGVLGGTLGQPLAVAPRPQQPSFWATGLTTTISPTKTNNVVFNYTRSFWQWGSQNAPPQLPGLTGAVEIGGESSSALIPYNINTQSVRQRFWDGQDKLLRDDFTMIHGNHLFGMGGAYQRNFDYHLRTDNGNGINNALVYQVNSSGINISTAGYIPSTVASSSASSWNTFYSEALGLVNQPQAAFTRTGNNLALQPLGSSAYDKSVIPYYSLYFYDTWHAKPSLTINYGIGWNLEMPPYETSGKQVMITDGSGSPIITTDFLAQRQAAALAGNPASYTPTVGFALVGNTAGGGRKYPYDPFYKEFSPRISMAWQPRATDGILGKIIGNGKTVVRGGYARIYGRLNGVNLVLSPLLGVGLIQAVACTGPTRTGTCAGSGNVDPTTVFRIGPDGMTAPLPAVSANLAQPFYPGVGTNALAGDASALDPHYRPDRTDQFTLTLQREINSHLQLEVGYIGKLLKNETTEIDIDSVPYMTTLGGQSFSQAYANIYWQNWQGVSPASMPTQAFFENAMGGANSAYCAGFGSCTAAVASKNASLFKNTQVTDLWNTLSKANGWTLGRTMISSAYPGGSAGGQGTSISESGSLGWSNYNALFLTMRMHEFHGLTAISNFTWGRALGTGPIAQYNSAYTTQDPYNLHASYGPNSFDIKAVYNLAMYYQPPVFRGQKGVLGHILGGWTISPLFTAQSGNGIAPSYSEVNCTGCQAFGEVGNSSAATGSVTEDAVGFTKYTGTNSAKYGVFPTDGVGNRTPNYGLNMFSSPSTVIAQFRPCVLGYDTSCGGYYNLRNLPTWNVDASVSKDIAVHKESVGATLYFAFTNVLNHFQPGSPSLSLSSPTSFGQITGQANTPRSMEFGIRAHF